VTIPQEEHQFRPEEQYAFPGHAVSEQGYMYPNANPGLGLDIDEEKAAALVDPERMKRHFSRAGDRRADGTIVRP